MLVSYVLTIPELLERGIAKKNKKYEKILKKYLTTVFSCAIITPSKGCDEAGGESKSTESRCMVRADEAVSSAHPFRAGSPNAENLIFGK